MSIESASSQSLSFQFLKDKQRSVRGSFPEGLALRVHRAISWLERSEQCDDQDGKFIFLWISFNAAYAQEVTDIEQLSEKKKLESFLEKISDLDSENALYSMIWGEYSSSIRLLLANQYLYSSFWNFQNQLIPESEWKKDLEQSAAAVNRALGRRDTTKILSIVVARLYTLRNQLMHGGATWNSAVNREQIKDGNALLVRLVTHTIDIMMDNPRELWGQAAFPVIEQKWKRSPSQKKGKNGLSSK